MRKLSSPDGRSRRGTWVKTGEPPACLGGQRMSASVLRNENLMKRCKFERWKQHKSTSIGGYKYDIEEETIMLNSKISKSRSSDINVNSSQKM